MRRYLEHWRNCRKIRKLLRAHPGHRLGALYWYDLPLAHAISWRGFLRVVWWNLRSPQRDEIAANHDFESLYFAPSPKDGTAEPAPTVWRLEGVASRPWWDEPSSVTRALRMRAPEIAAEFKAVSASIDTHPDQRSLVDRGRWTGMFLYGAGGQRNEILAAECPVTTQVVEALPLCPHFGFVMFSGMEPRTHVAPHSGSTNLRLRHHLAVDVPEPEKGRIRVGAEWRRWLQGEVIAFDDSYQHEVVYDGEQPRIVLVVDTWHPALGASDIAILSDPVFQPFGKTRRSSTPERGRD